MDFLLEGEIGLGSKIREQQSWKGVGEEKVGKERQKRKVAETSFNF